MTVGKIKDLFNLSGKVAVLTGSAGRLGTRFAHVLSKAGCHVILVDPETTENKKLELELKRKYHTKPLALELNAASSTDVKKLVKTTVAKYKKIDILINNAHVFPRNDKRNSVAFERYPLDLWEKIVSDNLRMVFLCSQEIGKIMVKQNGGVIINISSIYGMVGPDQRIYGKSNLNSPISYAASKGAIVNLTRFLAAHWQKKNIRVNTLTLGGVFDSKLHTDQKFIKNYSEKTILGRMARKEDYDGAILFLSSDASAYMTGANLIVDGGWTAW